MTSRATRFVKPDVAIQDGAVRLTTSDGAVETGPYTSVWVRNDGKWQLARVQDLAEQGNASASANFDSMKQLDWLVGDWVSDNKDNRIQFSCKWSKNQNYIAADQVIQLKDREALELTHIIGWDPLHQHIRSWVFDSRGGFGEGTWSRNGNEWQVDASGVLADGRQASSRSTWKYVDTDTWEWSSTDREIDGKPMPDVRVRYVRTQAKGTTSPSPQRVTQPRTAVPEQPDEE